MVRVSKKSVKGSVKAHADKANKASKKSRLNVASGVKEKSMKKSKKQRKEERNAVKAKVNTKAKRASRDDEDDVEDEPVRPFWDKRVKLVKVVEGEEPDGSAAVGHEKKLKKMIGAKGRVMRLSKYQTSLKVDFGKAGKFFCLPEELKIISKE